VGQKSGLIGIVVGVIDGGGGEKVADWLVQELGIEPDRTITKIKGMSEFVGKILFITFLLDLLETADPR
jgi:hypothetical protein